MGSSSREWEQKPVIKELTQGRDFARQLQTHFQQSSPHQGLVQKILSSFNKALAMLNQPAEMEGEPQLMGPDASTESPRSVSGSPSSDNSDQAFKDQERRDISKKRKTLPKWTEQVRVCSGTGLEGPLDDGYSWRKYGQKDILGAKYPRGYYRCTYRNGRGCLATKQVQRSDEDPTIFDVTYSGKHTCFHSSHALVRPSPSSSPKQIEQQQQPQEESNAILLNFRSGLKVKTEDLDSPFSFPPASLESSRKHETGHYLFSSPTFENNTSNSLLESLSPPFISPATSESNYFPVSPCRMNSTFTPATSESNYLSASPMSSFMGAACCNVQGSESDLTEIFSASTSVTNSPMMDLDFTLEPLEFDPNFPFDASFFS